MSKSQRTTEEPSAEPTDDPTTTPRVTHHAALRYRQRVDAAEPFPREKIEELLATATPSGEAHGDGVAWVADEAVLVTDSAKETVKTVLRRREGR